MFVCLYSQLSAALADLHRFWRKIGFESRAIIQTQHDGPNTVACDFFKGSTTSVGIHQFNWFSTAPLEGVPFYLWNWLPFQTLSHPICLFLHEYWVEVLYWSFVHACFSTATTEWWTASLALAHKLTSSVCPTCIYVSWWLSRLHLVALSKCNLGVSLLHRNQLNSPWDIPYISSLQS